MRQRSACGYEILGYPIYSAIDVVIWIPTWLLLRGTAGASFVFLAQIVVFFEHQLTRDEGYFGMRRNSVYCERMVKAYA